MKETIIKIKESGEVLVEEMIDDIKSIKYIHPDELMKCIKSSITGQISSGLLPNGCLSYSQNDRGDKSICLLFPENNADINYYGTIYNKFPLPKIVFGFDITAEGRICNCRLGIPDNESLLKPSTQMYYYPFSNVNGFHLCTGNNLFPICKSLHTVASLPYYILSMPNNNDRFSTLKNKPKIELRELFELLKDKQPEYYYSDILLPFNNVTLNDFIYRREFSQ